MESVLWARIDFIQADGSSCSDLADAPFAGVGPYPYIFVEDGDLRYHTPPLNGRLEMYAVEMYAVALPPDGGQTKEAL
jgi:hypothetical protein